MTLHKLYSAHTFNRPYRRIKLLDGIRWFFFSFLIAVFTLFLSNEKYANWVLLNRNEKKRQQQQQLLFRCIRNVSQNVIIRFEPIHRNYNKWFCFIYSWVRFHLVQNAGKQQTYHLLFGWILDIIPFISNEQARNHMHYMITQQLICVKMKENFEANVKTIVVQLN